jgi:hypothetical protein
VQHLLNIASYPQAAGPMLEPAPIKVRFLRDPRKSAPNDGSKPSSWRRVRCLRIGDAVVASLLQARFAYEGVEVSAEIEQRRKMLIRALIVPALAVGSWSAPARAQQRAIWLCAGARPSWSLQFAVDFASWVRGKEAITYRGFTALEPDVQRTGNRITGGGSEEASSGASITLECSGL